MMSGTGSALAVLFFPKVNKIFFALKESSLEISEMDSGRYQVILLFLKCWFKEFKLGETRRKSPMLSGRRAEILAALLVSEFLISAVI